jgi:hypothetical protein
MMISKCSLLFLSLLTALVAVYTSSPPSSESITLIYPSSFPVNVSSLVILGYAVAPDTPRDFGLFYSVSISMQFPNGTTSAVFSFLATDCEFRDTEKVTKDAHVEQAGVYVFLSS